MVSLTIKIKKKQMYIQNKTGVKFFRKNHEKYFISGSYRHFSVECTVDRKLRTVSSNFHMLKKARRNLLSFLLPEVDLFLKK